MWKFVCTGLCAGLFSTAMAAPFVNLGFDDQTAYSATDYSFAAPVSDILPGWQVSYGPLSLDTLGLNYMGLVTRIASVVHDTPWSSASLFGLLFRTDQINAPFSLVQTAQLPVDAGTLSFDFQFVAFGVAINGQPGKVLNQGEWSEFGYSQLPQREVFDISEFAGQTVELRITQLTMASHRTESYLDNIRINPIPEPKPVLLLAVGFTAACVHRVFRGRNNWLSGLYRAAVRR